MLRYFIKRSSGEAFSEVKRPEKIGTWVYGAHASNDDIDDVVSLYGLDRNIVRDVLDENELPRVEYGRAGVYVFLKVPHATKRNNLLSRPLLAVVLPKALVTLSKCDDFTPNLITERTLPFRTHDSRSLLLAVFATIISQYEQHIQHTGRAIKDVGQRLKTHEVTNADFIRFVTIEDNLSEYQLSLDGMRAVASRLRDDRHRIFTASELEAIDDLVLHIDQLLASVKSQSLSVSSIRNAYSTIANNVLNQRMKTLTVLTVLIALPNVFYGMYGMNIALPFADQPWAYGAVIGVSLVMILLVIILAKKFRVF